MYSGEAEINISFWISIVVLLCCLAYTIFQVVFFTRCQDRLEEPSIKERFGSAYENYNLKETHKNRAWHPIVSTGRLILFTIALVVYASGLVTQVLTI